MNSLTRTFVLVVTGIFAYALLVAGCDSLNLQPPDEISSEQVWQDAGLTEAYLNDVYSGIGFGFGSPTTSGATDEAVFTHGWGTPPVRMSNMTPADRGFWDAASGRDTFRGFDWEQVYARVRDLNIFLSNVETSEVLPPDTRQTMLGEAYFLRAFFYHNLMRLYGGVPLIDGTFELQGDLEQFQVPRGTFEETLDFIVSDLDAAAARLSATARRGGAPTEGAAMALKCRVLTHAASDLYHDGPFSAPEVAFQGGDQMTRWRAAKDACQAVMDLGQYSLEPAPTPEAYHELFTKGNPGGTIWARYFDESTGSAYNGQHNISLWSSPNGYNSWAGDTPTQEHVDAYEMADGSEFAWDGGDPVAATEPIDVENPYENRDPRLYANIMYNGSDWRARPSGLADLDPMGVIQTGWYEHPDRGGDASTPGIQGELRPGLDTREGPVQVWNGTKTGYYVAKFVDRDIDPSTQQAHNPWVFLRYAEVLLNYAEASAELGEDMDAKMALDQVRDRVGMPAVPIDGGPGRTLMERIRQEREVELAFEEHRYFDIRRWMIAPQILSEPGRGIRVEGSLDSGGELLVDHRYDYRYNVIQVEQRQWNDNAYFAPIHQDEMNRNTSLVQNPGY